MANLLGIATGKSVTNSRIKNVAADWVKIAEKLTRFVVTEEDYADYMTMPFSEQSRIKDVGYFIGGQFKGSLRKRDRLKFRSIVTLDLDFLPPDDFDDVDFVYSDYEYVLHSTHKHSSERPRYRLVFPLARNVKPDEYQPIARYLANLLDIDYFDHTAFRVSQLMYWPSRSADGEEVAVHNAGLWADPDDILATYDDWSDFGEWPKTETETHLRGGGLATAEDPYDKTGIIGAFCRMFNIHEAIEFFELPYEQTEWDNRYRPIGASGASGAVVYPSDQCDAAFLYSHHESDVVGSMNVNSWDLVRMHLFHELDDGEEYESPSDAPSYKAMTAHALKLKELQQEIADGEFSNVDDLPKAASQDADPDDETETTPAAPAVDYESLHEAMVDARNMNRAWRVDMVNQMAAAKLTPTDVDELLGLLQRATGVGKRSLRTELQDRQLEIVRDDADHDEYDTEQRILKIILARWQRGRHIKRIGRQWWAYSHGVWQRKDDEFVQGIVQEILWEFKQDELMDATVDVRVMFERTKISTLSSTMYQLFNSHTASRESSADPLKLTRRISVPTINCLSGELHFNRDGSFELVDHDPDNFHTTQINVEYDPDAECPEWDRFVNLVFSSSIDPEENIRHLEEILGYALQMSRWMKAFVLFKGNKDTGKTTVASVLERMMGPAVLSTEMSTFGDSKSAFAESNLVGKQLVLDDDFKKGAQLPDGFIKRISEEKAITADVKFAAPINFVSRALPMILSNYWPMTRDVTDAFRERAVVVEFLHRLTDAEKSNERRDRMLNDELPGIMNRLIAGISRLYKRQRWLVPTDCQLAHGRWVDHANPVSMFMSEVLEERDGEFLRRSEVWTRYLNWYRHSNPSGRASSKSEFYERIEAIIGLPVKRNGIFGWTGYVFSEAEPAEEFTDD